MNQFPFQGQQNSLYQRNRSAKTDKGWIKWKKKPVKDKRTTKA